MAFRTPAIILWPGLDARNENFKNDQDVFDSYHVCVHLLRSYFEWVVKTDHPKHGKVVFPKEDLRLVQMLMNRASRNYVREFVSLLTNFEIEDGVKSSNLYYFYDKLYEGNLAKILWCGIGFTRSFINFNGILKEMNRETFDLFEESISNDEIRKLSESIVRDYPDVLNIIRQREEYYNNRTK